MAEYQIAFHVQEENEAGANEWLSRAKKILDAHESELVSKRTIDKPGGGGACIGSSCPGHVMTSLGQPQDAPSDTPRGVLQMGPRE